MDIKAKQPVKANARIFSENKCAYSIYIISKFFGIFPYSLKDGYFRFSIPYCFISVITTIYICLQVLKLLAPRSLSSLLSKATPLAMKRAVFMWFVICLSVLYVISVVTSTIRVRSINKIVSTLDEIDRLLASAGQRRLDPGPSFRDKNYLGFLLAFLFFVYCPWKASYRNNEYRAQMFLLLGGLWLAGAQFTALGNLIVNRLAVSNAVLEDIRFLVPFSLRTSRMATLSNIQNRLCDLCFVLEASFTKTLTVLIAACFFGLTVGAYLITSSPSELTNPEFLIPSSKSDVAFIMQKILILVLSLNTVWQIVACSSEITYKVRESRALIILGCNI